MIKWQMVTDSGIFAASRGYVTLKDMLEVVESLDAESASITIKFMEEETDEVTTDA